MPGCAIVLPLVHPGTRHTISLKPKTLSGRGVIELPPTMKRKQRAALENPAKKKQAKAVGLAVSQAIARSQATPRVSQSIRFQVTSPNVERKNIDVGGPGTLTLVAGSAAWTAGTLLNPIAQGTTANQRVGRKVTMLSVMIRYAVALASTSTGGSPIRFKVVYDKQSNGAAPAITDIVTVDTFTAPNNLDNSDRFVTLIDKITAPISAGSETSVAAVEKASMSLETMFTGTAGAIANILSGSVYIFAAQDSAIATANATFSYISRIRFTDQ